MCRFLSLSFLLFCYLAHWLSWFWLFFLLFLSSLCRHDEGKKKKGKQSCWQRSASPARGPCCLGLVHHGRQSHLQIRRETLKECKWDGKRERDWERRDREERKKGEQTTLSNACTNTHTHTHIPVFGYEDKRISSLFLLQTDLPPNLCQSVLTQFLKPAHDNFSRSTKSWIQSTYTVWPKY